MVETPKLECQRQFIHTHPFPLYVYCLSGGYQHRIYLLRSEEESESSNVYIRNLVSGSDNVSPWVKPKGFNLQLAMVQSFKPGDQYCLSPLTAHDFSLYSENSVSITIKVKRNQCKGDILNFAKIISGEDETPYTYSRRKISTESVEFHELFAKLLALIATEEES